MATTWNVDFALFNTSQLLGRVSPWTKRAGGTWSQKGSTTTNNATNWSNSNSALYYIALGVSTSYYWQDYYTNYYIPVFKCSNYSNYTYASTSYDNLLTMAQSVESNGDFELEYVTATSISGEVDSTVTALVNSTGFSSTTTDYKSVHCGLWVLAPLICPYFKQYTAPTLTNCSTVLQYSTDGVTYEAVDYKEGSSYRWQLYPYYKLIITPDNGYKYDSFSGWDGFENLYTYEITTSGSQTIISAVCKLIDKSPITFTDCETIKDTLDSAITYTVTCVAGGITYPTISTTQTLTNCTSDIPSTITLSYTSFIYNITADDNYYFDSVPTAVITYNDGTILELAVTLSTDTTACSLTITTAEISTDLSPTLTINATAVKEESTLTTIDKTLNHCTTDIPDTIDLTISTTYTWTVSADDGYYFSNAPTLGYFDVSLDTQMYTFSLSDDNTIATLTVDTSHMYTDLDDIAAYPLTLIANAVAKSTYTSKYGIINVYNVTIDNLLEFASERFTDESVDYGNYVLALFRLYCKITASDTSLLQVGKYTTDITASIPDTEIVTSSLGTITIPTYNNTAVDYESDIKLILPFYGVYNLDQKYIGTAITVKYYTNIVTGATSIIIYANDADIELLEADMRQDIVYVTSNNYHGDLQQSAKSTFGFIGKAVITYYTDTNKSVELPVQKNITSLSEFSDGDYVQLGNISEIVNTYLTGEELDELMTILQSGFYI